MFSVTPNPHRRSRSLRSLLAATSCDRIERDLIKIPTRATHNHERSSSLVLLLPRHRLETLPTTPNRPLVDVCMLKAAKGMLDFFFVVSLSPRLGGAQRNSSKNGGYNLFIDNKIRNEKQQQDRLPRLPPPEGRGRHTSHRKRIETHLKHSLLGPSSRSLDRRYQILRRCHRPTDEPRSCSCLPVPRGPTNQHQKIKTCRSKSGAQVSRLAHTNRRALVIISSWLLMFSLSPPPPRGGVVTAGLAGVVVGEASMPKRKSNRPTPECSVRCVCDENEAYKETN